MIIFVSKGLEAHTVTRVEELEEMAKFVVVKSIVITRNRSRGVLILSRSFIPECDDTLAFACAFVLGTELRRFL